jgi:hypothetical protein
MPGLGSALARLHTISLRSLFSFAKISPSSVQAQAQLEAELALFPIEPNNWLQIFHITGRRSLTCESLFLSQTS